MRLSVRRWHSIVEHWDSPQPNEPPLRKITIASIVENPFAGVVAADLRPMIEASVEVGRAMSERLRELVGRFGVQSYGKAGIAAECQSSARGEPGSPCQHGALVRCRESVVVRT